MVAIIVKSVMGVAHALNVSNHLEYHKVDIVKNAKDVIYVEIVSFVLIVINVQIV